MNPIDLAQTYLLALAVYREARVEPFFGKLLVAQVIKNRVLDPRWPDTYQGVVLQPRQFSAFNPEDANARVFPPDGVSDVWNDCVAIAKMVRSARGTVTEANHYHTIGVSPAWAAGKTPVLEVGRHRFYVL